MPIANRLRRRARLPSCRLGKLRKEQHWPRRGAAKQWLLCGSWLFRERGSPHAAGEQCERACNGAEIGEEEIARNVVALRDLDSGEQTEVPMDLSLSELRARLQAFHG